MTGSHGDRGYCGCVRRPWQAGRQRESGSLSAEHVDADGHCDDETDDDLLPERGDVEQVQAVTNDGQDESADEGAGYLSDATGKTRTADHHGRDGVKLVSCGRLGLGRSESSA